MTQSNSFQRILEFKKLVNGFFTDKEQPSQKDIDFYTNRIKEIEQLSTNFNRFYMLLNHGTFTPAYICKDFEKESGYTLASFKEKGLIFFFKKISFKQISTIFKVHIWGAKVRKMIQDSTVPTNTKVALCGLNFTDKTGNQRIFMLNQKLLTFDKTGEVTLSLLTWEEITYMHKSGVFWYRVEVATELGKKTKVFFENSTKKEADDVFSKRELEILKLSADRLTNQEIAEALNITKNTVERHRKNMIAKVGVTNMTGAVHLGKNLNLL